MTLKFHSSNTFYRSKMQMYHQQSRKQSSVQQTHFQEACCFWCGLRCRLDEELVLYSSITTSKDRSNSAAILKRCEIFHKLQLHLIHPAGLFSSMVERLTSLINSIICADIFSKISETFVVK